MDITKSVVSAAAIGNNYPVWLVALVVIVASLAVIFAAAVIWDFAGRITKVRSESGKVEVDLNPRSLEIKRK